MGSKMRIPRHGIVPVALLKQDGIHESEIRVYIILSMFQGHDDEAYPSRAKICEMTGISESTASRAIDNLDRLGWIERVQRGLNKTNLYRVMFDPSMDDISGSSAHETSGSATDGPPDVLPMQHPSIPQKEHLKKSAKEKEVRHKHGEYKHVLLTSSELERFKADFPLDWEQRIKACDEYCQQYGKKYADYNLTMRKWAAKDKAQNSTPLFDTDPNDADRFIDPLKGKIKLRGAT